MKRLFVSILLLTTLTTQADFFEAQERYDQKDFTSAFNEFQKLAKLGNVKSQYNVAVMLSKGEGVQKNLIEAYAWASLVSSIDSYKPLASYIKEQLPPVSISEANNLFEKYHKLYALENSKVILGPIVEVDKDNNQIDFSPELVFETRKPPMYPREMLQKHIQGWVNILFYLYPDGSVRDIQVVEQLPVDGAFHAAAIKSIESYKMHYEKDGIPIILDQPRAITQRINFTIKNSTFEFTQKHKNYLNKLKINAEKGDLSSQYEYSVLQERFYINKEIDQKQINQWLFNASQEGIADAQYRLGMNIFNGKACRIEKQKGLDWIFLSAQIGSPYAQYTAYKMLTNEEVINRTKQEPLYWLGQAAKNGLSIAQLNYANEISHKQNPTKEELVVAKQYLKNYAKETYKTIQWYQVSALIDGKLNNSKNALKKTKKALKLAKKQEWDLTELQQQLAMFEAH